MNDYKYFHEISKANNVVLYFDRGHNNPIWDLDVSALNLYVATGSQDKTARLWTLDKTYPLRLYVGHHNSVTVSIRP